MTSTNPAEFVKDHGILGYFHYLVFPIDLFVSGDEEFEAAREQRVVELTPIMFWLIPLLLFLSNFTALTGIGLALFFLLEIIIMVILSVIYVWRLSLGFLIELTLNYILSFIILGIFVSALMFLWASCGIIIAVILIIAVIAFFSRGGYDDYYYDDDW